MTKKDYELFANEVNEMKGLLEQVEIDTITTLLCRVFKKDNVNFKEFKFLEACESGKHIRKSISGKV